MADPFIDVQFVPGTVITSPWLNGINDSVKELLTTGRPEIIVNSVAALRLVDSTKNTSAMTLGYYAAGDQGHADYWMDASDTTSPDNGGTVIVAVDGARWKIVNFHLMNSYNWGAKGDQVTDDTARIQAYINWCSSFSEWKPMVIAGNCLITSSLIVNRLVDSTTNEWRVIGANNTAGLYVDSNIDIFDSTLPMPGPDPQNEAITFKDIKIAAGNTGTNAHVLSKKFLRLKFENVYFLKIRLIASTTYLQSFYLHYCNIRFWPGVFCAATHAFDTHFDQTQSEFGAGYLTNFPNGSYNLTFSDGLHEGSGGGLISGGGFRQLKIDGYYLEGNALQNIALDAGGTNYDVSVQNCIFASTAGNVANANFYDIVWGPTVGAYAGGNYHTNGRLHDNSGLPASGLLIGAERDNATLVNVRTPLKADKIPTPVVLTATNALGVNNYASACRQGDYLRIEFSFTFAGASGSPAILILPMSGVTNVFGGIVYLTDYTATPITIAGGQSHPLTLGSPDRLAVTAGPTNTPISYTNLAGKTVDGELVYRVF